MKKLLLGALVSLGFMQGVFSALPHFPEIAQYVGDYFKVDPESKLPAEVLAQYPYQNGKISAEERELYEASSHFLRRLEAFYSATNNSNSENINAMVTRAFNEAIKNTSLQSVSANTASIKKVFAELDFSPNYANSARAQEREAAFKKEKEEYAKKSWFSRIFGY